MSPKTDFASSMLLVGWHAKVVVHDEHRDEPGLSLPKERTSCKGRKLADVPLADAQGEQSHAPRADPDPVSAPIPPLPLTLLLHPARRGRDPSGRN